jgi:hypothetical protein
MILAGQTFQATANAITAQSNALKAKADTLDGEASKLPPDPAPIGGGSGPGGIGNGAQGGPGMAGGFGGGGDIGRWLQSLPVPNPVIIQQAPSVAPGYYQPAYSSIVAQNASAPSERPPAGFKAIALGWNGDGRWSARKSASLDVASVNAVTQCNSQYGNCTLSDAAVSTSAFGCLAVASAKEDSTRLFAATGGSLDAARAAVSEQAGNAGLSDQLQYAECNR